MGRVAHCGWGFVLVVARQEEEITQHASRSLAVNQFPSFVAEHSLFLLFTCVRGSAHVRRIRQGLQMRKTSSPFQGFLAIQA